MEPVVRGAGVGGAFALPLQDYSKISSAGAGVHGSVDMSLLHGSAARNVRVTADLGVLKQVPTDPYLSSLVDLWWQSGMGYRFDIGESRFSITPELGYGGNLHIAEGTFEGTSESALFYDSLFAASAKGAVTLSQRVAIYFQPGYQLFLEENSSGQQFFVLAGVEMIR